MGGHARLEVFQAALATRTVLTNHSLRFVMVEIMFSHVLSSPTVNVPCSICRMGNILERAYRGAVGT